MFPQTLVIFTLPIENSFLFCTNTVSFMKILIHTQRTFCKTQCTIIKKCHYYFSHKIIYQSPGIISPGTGFTASTCMQESLFRAHLALVTFWPCTFTAGRMAWPAASFPGKESPTTVTYTLTFMKHFLISASVNKHISGS